jgi:hypothetical protein
MGCRLPSDCLNDIFEHLEEDKPTLHSCLLVNCLWCEVSVRILWRNIWNSCYRKCPLRVTSSILSTLVSCLPDESKELLHKSEIFISTPTSKSPLFNYAAFCKVISIPKMNLIVANVLKNNKLSINLITNEITKMFMKQISSLKRLTYYGNQHHIKFSFTYFPGVRNLSELICDSNLPSLFLYQMSQICHNLQFIVIFFCKSTTNELKRLISSQNNLKSLILIFLESYDNNRWTQIIPSLKKHSSTLINLHINDLAWNNISLSFVNIFTNLQKLIFESCIEDFGELQYSKFPKLRTLKIHNCLKLESIVKFLEVNGSNLRNLFIGFKYGEIDILKKIFISCKYLVSIKIYCGNEYLIEKEVLETIINYSPNNFCKLKLFNTKNSNLSPEDLKSFLISWKDRTPTKSLKLIIIKEKSSLIRSLDDYKENMKIIEKYKDLGIIKFRIKYINYIGDMAPYIEDFFVNRKGF